MTWYVLLVAAVGVERLAELVVAQRNLAWSRARGGMEFGARHYPVMVVLHPGLLVGARAEVYLLHRPFLPWLGWPMLAVVVCWSMLLFCGYGLVSPINATVVASLALGAIAIASAIFLIIELTNPYVGLIRPSPGPIIETLKALGT